MTWFAFLSCTASQAWTSQNFSVPLNASPKEQSFAEVFPPASLQKHKSSSLSFDEIVDKIQKRFFMVSIIDKLAVVIRMANERPKMFDRTYEFLLTSKRICTASKPQEKGCYPSAPQKDDTSSLAKVAYFAEMARKHPHIFDENYYIMLAFLVVQSQSTKAQPSLKQVDVPAFNPPRPSYKPFDAQKLDSAHPSHEEFSHEKRPDLGGAGASSPPLTWSMLQDISKDLDGKLSPQELAEIFENLPQEASNAAVPVPYATDEVLEKSVQKEPLRPSQNSARYDQRNSFGFHAGVQGQDAHSAPSGVYNNARKRPFDWDTSEENAPDHASKKAHASFGNARVVPQNYTPPYDTFAPPSKKTRF